MFDFLPKEMLGESSDPSPPKNPPSDAVPPRYIKEHFQLPITYLPEEEKHPLSPIVANDLELTVSNSSQSMYSHIFDLSGHSFAEEVLVKYQDWFTSNTDFLQDSQEVMLQFDAEYENQNEETVSCETIQTYWTRVKHDPDFLQKYSYLDWEILKPYNKSSTVLQAICLANMLSPLSSFIVPFLFLLFPFVILKIQGVPITFEIYFTVLKSIAQHHFIGKAINGLQTMAIDQLIYVVGMFFLYMYQMYQNVIHCIRFYNNIEKINLELCTWKRFVSQTTTKMKRFVHRTQSLKTYEPFRKHIESHLNTLEEIKEMLKPVCPFECSLYKLTEIGYMLQCYYELYDCPEFEDSICFAMGFEGYTELMRGLYRNVQNHVVHCGQFKDPELIDEKEKDKDGHGHGDEDGHGHKDKDRDEDSDSTDTVVIKEPDQFITNQYYPVLRNDSSVVKNNANLDSNHVITGPNASGKTTFLKTTALNIVFTQQLGVGFYDSCVITPYTHIHSYLNIPDTSGRDSLFQAESRRCKEILDSIAKTPKEHHFCIFDELYSGTNPEEATQAAYAFMKYVSAKPNVKLLLTTHYVSICDKWDKDNIENYQMDVSVEDGEFEYTYRIKPGVSRVHGAIHILEQMDYPQSILDRVKENTSDKDVVV